MKLADVEVGSEYGLLDPKWRRWSYSPDVRHVKALGIEETEEEYRTRPGPFEGSVQRTRKVKRIRVEIMDHPGEEPPWSARDVAVTGQKGDTLLVSGKWLAGKWEDLCDTYERAHSERQARREARLSMSERLHQLLGDGYKEWELSVQAVNSWRNTSDGDEPLVDTRVTLSGSPLEELLQLAEVGKVEEEKEVAP